MSMIAWTVLDFAANSTCKCASGEPIYYDKELERSLAINAKIGKNIYFAFGLTSASHYLDIGLTFILTSASHSF